MTERRKTATPVWSQTNRSKLRKSMDTLFPIQEAGQCRVCSEPVVDGRWNYCSARCREIAQAVQKMFIWESVRERVKSRDDETCQRCGESVAMRQRAYWQCRERVDELTDCLHPKKSDSDGDQLRADYDRWRRARRELQDRYGQVSFTDGWLHVDHITPISEGGHPFDEQNLQVLCRPCHQEKTAEENRDPARPAAEVSLDDYLAADGGDSR